MEDGTPPQTLGRKCGNCGKESWLALVAEHEGKYSNGEGFRAGLYVCGGCGKPSLATYSYYVDDFSGPMWILAGFVPAPHALPWEDLPDGVREEHCESWNCFHGGQNKAAMLMARTALQHTCRALGAKKGKLAAEIADLELQGKITPDLRSLADEVRLLGNDVAHPPEDIAVVDPGEAEELLAFLDDFLNTTLVLPEKTRQRIAARKARKEGK